MINMYLSMLNRLTSGVLTDTNRVLLALFQKQFDILLLGELFSQCWDNVWHVTSAGVSQNARMTGR